MSSLIHVDTGSVYDITLLEFFCLAFVADKNSVNLHTKSTGLGIYRGYICSREQNFEALGPFWYVRG